MSWRCGGLAAALLAAVGGSARADGPPRVVLDVAPCVAAPADEIRRLLAIELGAPLVEPGPAARDATHASVTCWADGVVELRVEDPAGKATSRTLALGAENARARLVALALAELVAARPVEPAAPAPAAIPTAAVLRASPPALASTDSVALRWFALVGGEHDANAGWLAGGGVRVARASGALDLIGELRVHHGAQSVALGDVSTDVIDLTAAAALREDVSRVSIDLGAGVRGGTARLGGMSSEAGVISHHFWAPWLAAEGIAVCEIAVARHTWLAADVTAGYVIVPVTGLAANRGASAIDGTLIGVHAGIGRAW